MGTLIRVVRETSLRIAGFLAPACIAPAGTLLLFWGLVILNAAVWSGVLAAAPPRVLVPGYELTLVAEAPNIVTPIAVAFDHDGQLLVIESHTHQRPDAYAGPKNDRILRCVDTDADGKLDVFTEFFAESAQTMSLARGPQRWIYVATRREIFRLRDQDGDGQADERESIVRLETQGDYPHNGLAGLVFAPDGDLYFGMGENLGEPYRLVGSDGSSVADEKEGGNIFRCSPEGGRLERYATGFWNPFGNVFGPHGRLYSVDNDPDASPPCRLLQVVPGGDYGYQFRYGRSGRHPLQAWDAELPGTLPMAAGTGEAPCQIVVYHGRLWVTSWGDYRLEAFALQTVGASVQGQAETIVQGDREFRPVGLAIAPDGSLLISDWVDRSYPVHGRGRLWRLSPTQDAPTAVHSITSLSETERQAERLRTAPTLAVLEADDAFLRQAAVYGWSRSDELLSHPWQAASPVRQRLGLWEARRWRDPALAEAWIEHGLADADPRLNLFALRLIGERHLTAYREPLLQKLRQQRMADGQLATALLATLRWLDGNDSAISVEQQRDWLNDPQSVLALRQLALQQLPADDAAVQPDQLLSLAASQPDLAVAIVGILSERGDAASGQALLQIARDAVFTEDVRADAVSGLAGHRAAMETELQELAGAAERGIAREARRVLGQEPALGGAVATRLLDGSLSVDWQGGDPAAGRRAFFRTTGAKCGVCHRHGNRGGSIGPELTTISRRGDAAWLVQTILDPNRDVAPKYAAVTIVTHRGQTWTGLPLAGPGDDGQEVLVQPDGSHVTIALDQIEQRTPSSQSIMPTGLAELLSEDELRDILAFLQQ